MKHNRAFSLSFVCSLVFFFFSYSFFFHVLLFLLFFVLFLVFLWFMAVAVAVAIVVAIGSHSCGRIVAIWIAVRLSIARGFSWVWWRFFFSSHRESSPLYLRDRVPAGSPALLWDEGYWDELCYREMREGMGGCVEGRTRVLLALGF